MRMLAYVTASLSDDRAGDEGNAAGMPTSVGLEADNGAAGVRADVVGFPGGPAIGLPKTPEGRPNLVGRAPSGAGVLRDLPRAEVKGLGQGDGPEQDDAVATGLGDRHGDGRMSLRAGSESDLYEAAEVGVVLVQGQLLTEFTVTGLQVGLARVQLAAREINLGVAREGVGAVPAEQVPALVDEQELDSLSHEGQADDRGGSKVDGRSARFAARAVEE